jgi:GT2 family glycosyltransferase
VHVVVVLNWNGRSDTVRCVESLVTGSPEVGVLVVDNGSFDGAIDEVKTAWPRVHVLQLPRNLGFSGGMNAGIRHAIDDLGAEVVTVLNNDTVVPAGTMTRLADAAGAERAVSPTVRYLSEPEKIWFAGGSLDTAAGYPHHTATSELAPCEQGLRPSTWLAGCCVTAAAEVWERVGMFDDRFFLNFEDAEWSLRARSHGVELAVVCGVDIFHAVSASFTGEAMSLGAFYFLRNGLLFNRIVGGTRGSRMRFVRRFGLGGFRRKSPRERMRTLVTLGWAVGAYATGRFGPAPAGLQRQARRWHPTPGPARPGR